MGKEREMLLDKAVFFHPVVSYVGEESGCSVTGKFAVPVLGDAK
jgi:hypothetical protein